MERGSGSMTAGEREQLHKQYREQLSRYKSMNAELADLSWTLAELEQQLAELSIDASAGSDPVLLRRLSDLTHWKGRLEDRVLHHMFQVEELAATLAELRGALANVEA